MVNFNRIKVWWAVMLVILPLCTAQRDARFIEGLFRLGSHNPPSSTTTTTASRLLYAWKASTEANIDADDVYNSLSDLFDKPTKTKLAPKKKTPGKEQTTTSPTEIKEHVYKEVDMWKDPLANSDILSTTERENINKLGDFGFENASSVYNGNTAEFNKVVHEQYWTRFKGIIGNMKSILTQMYNPETEEEKAIFMIFDKVVDFGDNINLISRVYDTFDHELLDFLGYKWVDIKDTVINSSPAIKAIVAMETASSSSFSQTMAMGLLKQLGHMLHNQAFKHLGETDFVIELMRQTGFKDLEISEVFRLLEIKNDLLDTTDSDEFESRQFNRNNYNYDIEEKSGGYGHSGGGGGGYGGHQAQGYGGGYGMQGVDPFVLLAGLAFATFLAYLIYRLLSSTAAKRGVPDMSLALDLSDLPEVMSNIYNWLEKSEETYGYDDPIEEESIEESFGESANTLWATFSADRLSGACMRRYLCDFVQDTSNDLMGSSSTLEQLAITGLAHVLGETKGGQMIDHVQSQILQGEQVTCSVMAPQCDDVMYHAATETRTKKKNTTTNAVQEFSDTTTESFVTTLDATRFADPK